MAEHVARDVNALQAALRDFPCLVLPGSAPDSYKSYLLRSACERQHRAVFRLYAAAYSKRELLGAADNTTWSSGILTSLLHSIALTAVPLCVVLNVSLAEAAELLSGALVVRGDSMWWVAASGQLMLLRTVRFVIDSDEEGQLPDHGVLSHFHVHRSASLRAPVSPPIVPLSRLPDLLASASALCVAHGPPPPQYPQLRPECTVEITRCTTVDEAIQQIRRAWAMLETAQRRAVPEPSPRSPQGRNPTPDSSTSCRPEGDDGSVPTVAQPPKAVSPAPPSEPQKAEMGEPGELSTASVQPPEPIRRPVLPFLLLRPRLFVFLDVDACNPVMREFARMFADSAGECLDSRGRLFRFSHCTLVCMTANSPAGCLGPPCPCRHAEEQAPRPRQSSPPSPLWVMRLPSDAWGSRGGSPTAGPPPAYHPLLPPLHLAQTAGPAAEEGPRPCGAPTCCRRGDGPVLPGRLQRAMPLVPFAWDPRAHALFPEPFWRAVRAFVLCSTLGDWLPPELQRETVRFLPFWEAVALVTPNPCDQTA